MSALEQEIIAKVRLLDTHQQQQVLDFLASFAPESEGFDFEARRQRIAQIHAEIKAREGENYSIDILSLLDEVREEPEWPTS